MMEKYFSKRSIFLVLLVFLIPLTLAYVLFRFYPLVSIVYYSLFRWDGVSTPVFIGFKNYIELLGDNVFWSALKNNFLLAIASIAIEIPLGLILAYLLIIEPVKGKSFFRVTYFTPMLMPSAAIGLLFTLLYDPTYGPINRFLRSVGLSFFAREWLADPTIALWSVILVIIWQWVGWYFILNLAAISSIPSEIFESAFIDGASRWTILKEIVIPMIKSELLMQITLALTGSLMYFDLVWIMTQGGPIHATELVSTWLYKQAFVYSRFGYASAIATVTTIITLAIGAYWILRVSRSAGSR